MCPEGTEVGAVDVGAGDGARGRRAEERHRDLELLAQDGQGPGDPGLAAGRERPQDRAADQHRARAERQRDRDVQPASDAAVDPDLGTAGDGVDDLLEDVDRRPRSGRAAARRGC